MIGLEIEKIKIKLDSHYISFALFLENESKHRNALCDIIELCVNAGKDRKYTLERMRDYAHSHKIREWGDTAANEQRHRIMDEIFGKEEIVQKENREQLLEYALRLIENMGPSDGGPKEIKYTAPWIVYARQIARSVLYTLKDDEMKSWNEHQLMKNIKMFVERDDNEIDET